MTTKSKPTETAKKSGRSGDAETTEIDKLFLELSQFTQAKTKHELELEYALRQVQLVACGERQVAEDDTGGMKWISEYLRYV